MDKINLTIINCLMENAKITLQELSRLTGISAVAVRKRILALERSGVIKGYKAEVDPFLLGFERVAEIGVDAVPEKVLSVFKTIKKMKCVKKSSLASGDHMMLFEVWCRNQKELEGILSKIEKIDGVVRVCPALFLKSIE